MPKRIEGPRTPSGRLSRAFVPKLPVVENRPQLKAAAHEAERARLADVAEHYPDTLLYAASTAVDEANTQLERLRALRNRLVVGLWAFESARGANFNEAAGVNSMVFWRVKTKTLDVPAVPVVEGTANTLDWPEIRRLATAKDIQARDDDPERLYDTVARIAELEGTHKAALEVRKQVEAEMLATGTLSKAAIARQIGRKADVVARLHAEHTAKVEQVEIPA